MVYLWGYMRSIVHPQSNLVVVRNGRLDGFVRSHKSTLEAHAEGLEQLVTRRSLAGGDRNGVAMKGTGAPTFTKQRLVQKHSNSYRTLLGSPKNSQQHPV